MTAPILFYRVSDPFGEFSNFAPFPLDLDGHIWPTSEHYFQAQKFPREAYREKIHGTPSPMIAARLGRSRAEPIRSDWETIKVEVMRRALTAKFTQHAVLRDLLLSTADAPLIEHTANDAYWADGGDGTGRNMLGELLMEVRAELEATARR